jgi:hypothetical protein
MESMAVPIRNLEDFSKTTLGSLKQPLAYNPVFPKYVLVFGRRSEYEKNFLEGI